MKGLWKLKISGYIKDNKRKKNSLKHLKKDNKRFILKSIYFENFNEVIKLEKVSFIFGKRISYENYAKIFVYNKPFIDHKCLSKMKFEKIDLINDRKKLNNYIYNEELNFIIN